MGGLYDRFPEIVTKTMSRLDSRSPFATDQWDEFRPPPMDVIDVDIKVSGREIEKARVVIRQLRSRSVISRPCTARTSANAHI